MVDTKTLKDLIVELLAESDEPVKAKTIIQTLEDRAGTTEGAVRSELSRLKSAERIISRKTGYYELPERESTYAGNRNIAEGAADETLRGRRNINYREEGPMEPRGKKEKLREAHRHIAYEVRDSRTGEVQLQVEFVVRVGETQERTVSLG